MDFSEALVAIKGGKKLMRRGWNGKGMWVEWMPPETPNWLPYIRMKTADDKYVPWLASQTDLLASDWQEAQ